MPNLLSTTTTKHKPALPRAPRHSHGRQVPAPGMRRLAELAQQDVDAPPAEEVRLLPAHAVVHVEEPVRALARRRARVGRLGARRRAVVALGEGGGGGGGRGGVGRGRRGLGCCCCCFCFGPGGLAISTVLSGGARFFFCFLISAVSWESSFRVRRNINNYLLF